MRLLVFTLFLSISTCLLGQKEYRIPFEGFVAIDSQEGTNVLKQDYNFLVKLEPDNKVVLKRKESHPGTEATIIERTPKYIAAKSSQSGYFFVDLENERLFTMAKFKERYITMGYFGNQEKVQATTRQMNEWQQAGKKPEEILSILKEKFID